MWRKTNSYRRCIFIDDTPLSEGYIFLPRAVRPEVKKYNPRSEVDHLRIYTDKEVVLLHNSDLIPPPTPTKLF